MNRKHVPFEFQTRFAIVSGKSLIGEHKAWKDRRFIKDLTLEQESSGFQRERNMAIVGKGKRLTDNKEATERWVKKQQKIETKHSLAKVC